MKAAGLTFGIFAAGLAGAVLAANAVSAASEPERLPLSAAPIPEDGLYEAGDNLHFVIDHLDGRVRLRFLRSNEVFYLASEPAALGGRVLKYDTGDVALQVTGWGGVTLYTEDAKSGVPVERADASNAVDPVPVAAGDVKATAAELAEELNVADDLAVGFAADWGSLADDGVRKLAVDSMRDATYAVERTVGGREHSAIADRLHIIRVVAGAKPGASFGKGVLTVTYAPREGPAGRPSSLVIRRVLAAAP
jgi:hypothetical protein